MKPIEKCRRKNCPKEGTPLQPEPGKPQVLRCRVCLHRWTPDGKEVMPDPTVQVSDGQDDLNGFGCSVRNTRYTE